MMSVPGRLEGCGQSSGEDRGAAWLFTAYMHDAERPGGGRGGESKRGEA